LHGETDGEAAVTEDAITRRGRLGEATHERATPTRAGGFEPPTSSVDRSAREARLARRQRVSGWPFRRHRAENGTNRPRNRHATVTRVGTVGGLVSRRRAALAVLVS